MWRSSRRLIVSCIQFIMQCGRGNLGTDDSDDISDYELQDVPVHFQPQTFGMPTQPRQEDLPHRPDVPGIRRNSPPEVVSRMRRALEEMHETGWKEEGIGKKLDELSETCLRYTDDFSTN